MTVAVSLENILYIRKLLIVVIHLTNEYHERLRGLHLNPSPPYISFLREFRLLGTIILYGVGCVIRKTITAIIRCLG